ncbi:unnamed protein product [Scytosiphon promiscuus]
MLPGLGRRALRHGFRCLVSPTATRCASREAKVHRCLASVAGSTSTWKADPAASSPKGEADAAAAGTTTAAAAAEPGSTSVEMDNSGNPNHILLYTGSKRNIRISSSVTVVNAFYWSFYVGVLEPHLPDTTWEPWGYLGIGFTAIMAATSHIFAKHWVSQISYLPDLKLLSIGTHTFFGGERMPRLVRLGGTIVHPTKDKAIYFTFKVRGDYFNSLLDSEDGVFHDRELLMRLLKASPNGVVPEPSAAESDVSGGVQTNKPALKWKKRKRSR